MIVTIASGCETTVSEMAVSKPVLLLSIDKNPVTCSAFHF